MKSLVCFTLAIFLATIPIPAATLYVSATSANPTAPYSTWSTAATNIQDALNAADPGAIVLVTNGIYSGGIVVSNPVTLLSVNGATATFIDGGGTNHCLFLNDGVNVSGFTLTNGWAANGGGVWCRSTNSFLTNCVMVGNTATNGGGAYAGTLFNCLLIGNSVAEAGLYGIAGGAFESALYNCTVCSNRAAGFGGVYSHGAIYNTIIYDNTAQYYTNFWDGMWLYYCCASPMPTNGVGNITNAPLFLDEAAADFQLQANSPCINAGTNNFVFTATDLAGNPRVAGGTVDIGAYEYVSDGPPVVVVQPQGQAVYTGGDVSFTAAAQGVPPLHWQWLFNETPVPGATSATLSLTALTTNQAGSYSVVVTNNLGSVTSQVAVLTVIAAAPFITLQPLNQTVNEGTNITFTAGAAGSLPLAWQWFFNGAAIPTATTSTLSLTVLSTNQAGGYSAVVTNGLGAATSQVAVLTVNPAPHTPPQITQQPNSATVSAGSNVTFLASASGFPPLAWQWLFNGTPIPNATQASLYLPAVTPNQAGGYSAVVTNSFGSVTSQVAVLTVQGAAPDIMQQPASQTVYAGSTAGFTAATASLLPPLSWQWFFNGTAIAAANGSGLTLPAVTTNQAGDYWVVVTNFLGADTSLVAVLTVLDAKPSITLQPVDQTLYAGSNATFTAAAVGSLPLSWYWLLNGAAIPGATSSNLTLMPVTTNQAGSYSAVVSNYLGSVTSQVAVLTVLDSAPVITLQPANQVVPANANVTFSADAKGSLPLTWQWLFNGTPIPAANNSSLTLNLVTPGQAGIYAAVVSNSLGSITSAPATLTIRAPATSYVWQDSPTPTPPYTNWDTAAHVIQDAVDAASAGDQVLVTNGVYATGGRTTATAFLTNRVAIDKPLTLRSVNGPDVTIIQGYQVPGTTNDDAAIRCVYLGSNAVLSGFTLTNGATRQTSQDYTDLEGGGVYGESWNSSLVTHCKLFGNCAADVGGGTYFCALEDCLLTGNSAGNSGGGAAWSNPTNCTIVANSANQGGGTANGALYDSIIYYNHAALLDGSDNYLADLGTMVLFCCTTPLTPVASWQDIDAVPQFVDQANGDFHLQSTSPCINAGNNALLSSSTDLDGNPRIIGGLVDLGAYEFQAPVVTAHYVWQDSPNPAPPYTNWDSAAHIIQDAVDAAKVGDEIVVTNGLYASGGRTAGSSLLTNRVALDKPLTLRSVNGPGVTIIQGYQVPGTTNGAAAIRCVYLGSGAVLSGFTLSNGATLQTGQGDADLSGGGVYNGSLGVALVTHCKLTGNSAASSGGGAFACALDNCLLTGNQANAISGLGGGACFGSLTNCTVVGNSANRGGGTASGILVNTIDYYNTAITRDGSDNYAADKGSMLLYCCTTPSVPFAAWQNIDTPPLFVDQANGDFHLQANSPCINAGLNASVSDTTDLDGNPRIVGSVDIGTFEYQTPTSVISYSWLQQYGLPTDGSADYADPDGDGMNNWQEWVCGTDPTNSLSALRLLSAVDTGTNVTVTWQSVGGVSYFLERIAQLSALSNLVSSNTNIVATNIVGQAGTTSFTDTNATGAGPFFYRIGVPAP